jgi:hypothetical protein
MNLPPIDISDKIVIIGYSGSGKTTLMDFLITTLPIRPIYVVDTVNFYSEVPDYNYSGVTKCKKPAKDKICVKMHSEETFEAFVRYLNHTKSQFFIYVDEIDRYCNPYTLSREVKLYFEEGRNFGRGGCYTVRRVGFLNKSILGNAHYLFLFKINNMRDLAYIGGITGQNIQALQYHSEHSFYIIDLHQSKILGEYSL